MTTKLVKWESEHGQMAKIRPSVACGGRNTTTAAQFEYDRHGFEGYLGNVGLKRWSPLTISRWLPFLVVSVCLAFSALYEMIEWWSAVALGEAADSFLGSQGDIWDTQWDMFLAMTGAIMALACLSRIHDRQIRGLG